MRKRNPCGWIQWAFLGAALLFVIPALKAAEYKLDPENSFLKFQPSARFGSGAGEFHSFQVQADIQETRLEESKIQVSIDIPSIDTGIRRRDKHLRSEDFFHADAYPVATFVVTGLVPAEENQFEATGDLTLRGVTKSIRVPVLVKERSGGLLVLEGKADVNRMDFGIRHNSRLNPIDDVVRISFRLVLKKS